MNASCAMSSATSGPTDRMRKPRKARSCFSTSIAKAAWSPRAARLESARSSSLLGATPPRPLDQIEAQPQGRPDDQRKERGGDAFMHPARIADDQAGGNHRDSDCD